MDLVITEDFHSAGVTLLTVDSLDNEKSKVEMLSPPPLPPLPQRYKNINVRGGRVFFFLRQISVCQSAKAAYYTKQRGKVLSVSLVSCSTWQPSTSCFLIPGVTIQLRFSLAYLSNNMQQHLSDRSRRIVPLVCSANTRKGERTMRTERFAFAAESDFPRG